MKSITSPLIVLQQEKVKSLWEFVAMSETLYECLLNRDFAGIEQQLEKRENLIQSIADIDRKILKASSGNSQTGTRGTSGEEEDPVLHNLKTLLQEAAELNAQCLAQAGLLREDFKKESATTRGGGAAARRCLQQVGSGPRFMDVQQS